MNSYQETKEIIREKIWEDTKDLETGKANKIVTAYELIKNVKSYEQGKEEHKRTIIFNSNNGKSSKKSI